MKYKKPLTLNGSGEKIHIFPWKSWQAETFFVLREQFFDNFGNVTNSEHLYFPGKLVRRGQSWILNLSDLKHYSIFWNRKYTQQAVKNAKNQNSITNFVS